MTPDTPHLRRRRRARARWSAAVLCATLGLFGCRGFHEEDEERPQTPLRLDAEGRVHLDAGEIAALDLHTELAKTGTLRLTRTRFGRVRARPGDDVRVTSPLPARLIAVHVSLGQRVEAGTPLLTLDPSLDAAGRAGLATRRDEIRGRRHAAEARLAAAQKELERQRALLANGLATPADAARAEAEVSAAEAMVAGLTSAEHTLTTYLGGALVLKAPTDGVVARIETTTGEVLAQGAPLARLLRANPRWVDLSVPPDDPTGVRYRIHACGQTFVASLGTRGLVVEGGLRSDRIVLDDPASSCLSPGRWVAVEVETEVRGVLIPRRAVVRTGTTWLAFVEVAQGVFAPRTVEVAGDDGAEVALGAGLSTGERVVVAGASELLGEVGFSRPDLLTHGVAPGRDPSP